MANQEQLAILKQGADVWNEWRKDNEFVEIDLSEVDLRNANLRGVKLYRANLVRANLSGAKLIEARLHETDLTGAELMEADLQKAILEDAIFNFAFLDDANLRQANLVAATFLEAYLTGTDLRGTDLRLCNLSGANLREANLNGATVGTTIFARLDLSETGGLEEVNHDSPSQISTDTLKLSEGKIPEVFLRGCGLSDWEIESAKLYNPDLTNDEIAKIQYRIYELRATQALQISPLFISYSHQDKSFVDKMDTMLTEKGVRFWRDIHDATAGRLETQIDRAMRLNPTVLLVLSKNSIQSDWVEHEVRTARELEKELGRDALCPIALDDSWKSSPWPKRVMEQVMEYNILDFSKWEDESIFEETFAKLLNGLDLFYKKPAI